MGNRAASESATGVYAIDPAQSRVGFVVRHAMVTKVRGSFNEFEGQGTFDIDTPAKSNLSLTIQVASIDTGNKDRNDYLRSADLLSLKKFPENTFQSTSVVAAGEGLFDVTGDLTMRGMTKPVTVNFEYNGAATDPDGAQRIGFDGTATINRTEWGIDFTGPLATGGILVGEKIALEFEVSAVRLDG